MSITKVKISLTILLLIFLFSHSGYAQEDRALYYRAISTAESGDIDFAFMKFHLFSQSFSESKFLEGALFATGEYYFSIADYCNAVQSFTQFVNNYPQSEAKLFSLAYLLEISRREGKKEQAKKLEKDIITFQQISLLFRDFQEYKYSSPLAKHYRAVYFIDTIEFYIDEELFAKVSY